jgi:hypothetical protein
MSGATGEPAGEGRERAGPGPANSCRNPEALHADPLYLQLQGLLQQARWEEAATVMAVLSRHYPGAAELEEARELLELRLSAEETWTSAASYRWSVLFERGRERLAGPLRRRAVRLLLVANLIVYLLLGLVWLFGAWILAGL